MAKKRKPIKRATSNSRPKKLRLPKPEFFDWRKFDPSMVRETGPDSLLDEMITYRDNLDELLRDEGKYVLIKGREIIGIYAERHEALEEAVARFGAQAVFVQKIAAKEPYIYLGGATL
jgi:hypothetical protein